MNSAFPSQGRIQDIFVEWADTAHKGLQATYSKGRLLKHRPSIGDVREELVRDVLEKFLPKNVEIGTGEIVDWMGNHSRQADIIISRGDVPVFRLPGEKAIFLNESVLAVIEIKSVLHQDHLDDALTNLSSVKDLVHLIASVPSQGEMIFYETADWIKRNGGLIKIKQKIDLNEPLGCSMQIWEVLHDVVLLLEIAEMRDSSNIFTPSPMNDLLHELIDLISKIIHESKSAIQRRGRIFNLMYPFLFAEKIPPETFLFAYSGYRKIEHLVDAVKKWQEKHNIPWFSMPRVILNDTLLMYRHYNLYHCSQYRNPTLMFMLGLCDVIARTMHFSTVPGVVSQVHPYFDGSHLGDNHPKNDPSYFLWRMTLDTPPLTIPAIK